MGAKNSKHDAEQRASGDETEGRHRASASALDWHALWCRLGDAMDLAATMLAVGLIAIAATAAVAVVAVTAGPALAAALVALAGLAYLWWRLRGRRS